MSIGLIFPGQAAQFVGMGRTIYGSDKDARKLIDRADEVLGYKLSEVMFDGPVELLTETKHTQPAVYLHSLVVYEKLKNKANPTGVAGHSLGEISACVAADVLSFEDGLKLVQKRAEAMQAACDANPGTMAAVLGLDDAIVEEICQEIDGVVPANYNCPGQLVISGTKDGIAKAIEVCKEKGARRALEIAVGGAFHSPLMEPAMDTFKAAIEQMPMQDATIPVFQNVDAHPHTKAEEIKENLIKQVISPVRWTDCILSMKSEGIGSYIEVGGKGRILQGMLRKISRELEVTLWQEG